MKEKQTILITGATGNIGGGAALALAKRGAKVVLLGRRLETLETWAASPGAKSNTVVTCGLASARPCMKRRTEE